jgi:hypothetical protein
MTAIDVATELTSLEECADRSSDPAGSADFGERQKLFFFFHVPKTGGSTINHAFVRNFGPQRVVRLNEKRGKGLFVDVISAKKFLLPPSAREEELYNSHIVGHVASLSIIEGRESKYHKACFWRHPADWFLSYYNWRNRKDKARQKRTYSFSDLVKSLSHNPMTQDLLLYCGDVPGWRYLLMSDRQKFERVLSIAEQFDLFADISRVDDYLAATGCGKPEGIKNRNTVPKKEKALRALDPETRHRLELLNPVDYYVHRVALDEDRAQAISEADRALTGRFQFRDLVRLIARPYYRLKVKFIPFFALGESLCL